MSDQAPGVATPEQPAAGPGALRILALAAVSVGVAALAGAAFVLSYSGLHAVALQAGISARLAKGYPLILDVLLVVILAAILWLRSAGWPSKLLAWACLLALLAAAAWADALHAAGHRLPSRPAAVTAAILPWALVLIAFALLLTMLHHARVRRAAAPRLAASRPVYVPPPPATAPLVPGFPAPEPAPPAPEPADPPRPAYEHTSPDTLRLVVPRQAPVDAADLASDGDAALEDPVLEDPVLDEPELDDPSSDEAEPEPTAVPAAEADNAEADETEVDDTESDTDGNEAEPSDPVGTDADADVDDTGAGDTGADDTEADDTAMPVFHRMWSSPTPDGEGSTPAR
jgi:hypothetical protein